MSEMSPVVSRLESNDESSDYGEVTKCSDAQSLGRWSEAKGTCALGCETQERKSIEDFKNETLRKCSPCQYVTVSQRRVVVAMMRA